jgi:hypothetical protein
MIVEIETITPNDAAAMLRKSEGARQRSLSEIAVEKMARAIAAGEWRVTHQGIAVDDAGVVLDGQHRLHAIVRADQAVTMMVTRGVDPALFDVLDTGRARTTADTLRIAGYPGGPALAAATRYLLAYDQIVGTTGTLAARTRLMTTPLVMSVVESERGDHIMQAVHVADRVAYRGLSRGGFKSWLTATIVVMHEGPPDDSLVLEFLERVADGAGLPAGSPILALRRYLMSDQGLIRTSSGVRPDIGMAVTIKAFNGWLNKGTRTLMTFKPGVEKMPAVAAVMPGGILEN